MLTSNTGAVSDRFNGPDLIIGMHNADEDRALRDRLTKVGRVNAASPVNGQIGHPRAQALEKVARCDDCRMLDPGGDDVIALVAQSEEHALKREIISFAAAACENDFIGVAAEQGR